MNPSETPEVNELELSPLELELIEFFVHLAGMLSLPKSVGEIYGLLYGTEEPQTFDVIQTRLNISKGSVSQGLRFLRNINAVKVVYVAGDRRDYYTAEHSLRRLADGFLRERIIPHLDNGKARIAHMESLLNNDPNATPHQKSAINSLKTWSKKASLFLPLLKRIIR